MDRARSYGFSANPIGYAEIDAWARLRGISLTPWEVNFLRSMDDRAIIGIVRRSEKAPPTKGHTTMSNAKGVRDVLHSLAKARPKPNGRSGNPRDRSRQPPRR